MPKKSSKKKLTEKVMVVARENLFSSGIWHGIKTENLQKYLAVIFKKHKFLPREKVENDPSWQQIIPYLIFENDGKIFVTRRKEMHSDIRLSNLYSIGIGGHINIRDIKGDKGDRGDGRLAIMAWAKREFEEEIEYHGNYQTKFLGLINDDSNDVGLVHLGLVIKVIGDRDQIAIHNEHKLGKLMTLAEAGKYYKRMETWSQIVYDFLRNNSKAVEPARQSQIFGILPDWLLADYIAKGVIEISPLAKNWQKNIDQVSIDFHLGGNIKVFRGGTYRFIDTRRGLPEDAMEEVNLKEGDPFILESGAFAIATTREVLKLPDNILGRLEGKSSLARLGILVHSTAARFDPGWNGAPVLELGNLGPKPAILYCGMPICAFTFEAIAAPVKMPYEGSRSDRYSGAKVAVPSRIHQATQEVGKRGRRSKQ